MRVLLDENIRQAFAQELLSHEVDHVEEVGLKSVRNGQLIQVAREKYDALITLDRGILFEHNHAGHDLIIAVLRVPDSTLESLRLRKEPLLRFLESALPGQHLEISD